MQRGHGIAGMAADYAGLIRDEFGGPVGIALGVSFGGHVGLSLAA